MLFLTSLEDPPKFVQFIARISLSSSTAAQIVSEGLEIEWWAGYRVLKTPRRTARVNRRLPAGLDRCDRGANYGLKLERTTA